MTRSILRPGQRAWFALVPWIAFCLVLVGCAAQVPTVVPEAPVEIIKSPNDHRSYRYLELPNDLPVLLVSDPQTDKAAASLTVLRGYQHEPAAYPGLAHFLEHMLFIGTEKYPEVDGYQQFIAAHGGSSNAYTSAEHTNYFFDVQPQHFQAAMDRFAQFFISPLLDPSYVDREKHAVHSEYQLQIRDDGWRGSMVLKAAMRDGYVGKRFYIGSLETLGEGVDQALRQFFRENYSADQMVLVALSNESLDGMETWIRPLFGAIENRRIGPAPVPGPAFDSQTLPARLTWQTLNQRYQVRYSFPVPPVDPHYRIKPAEYLTNLLGHEGEGSLHQLLKSSGLIESLAAGVNRLDSGNALITVSLELTDAGRGSIDSITGALFAYIELLKKNRPQAWRYGEQAKVAELSFRFQEPSSPTGFVYRTAPKLGLYPPQDVLIADYLMASFEPDLIGRYLEHLRPDNVLIEVSGPDVETDRMEPWFQVPYRLETGIRPPEPNAGHTMHLPEPNPFIPENLDLVSSNTEPPALTIRDTGLELYLAPDVEFRVPRANQSFTLAIEGGLDDPESVVLASIYDGMVQEALTPFTYPAMLAGLSYNISTRPEGLRVGVSGYSDKQLLLLEEVLSFVRDLKLTPDRFERVREELIRDWRNFRFERPYMQAYAALTQTVLDTSFPPDVLAQTAGRVTLADLERWRGEKLASASVLGLSHGNLTEADLRDVQTLLREYLNLEQLELRRPRLAVINEPLLLEISVEHDDSAQVLYIQDPEASYQARAVSALAAQTLKQKYFTSLRTEQQLGYVVSMTNRTIEGRGALVFIVQSPKVSAAHLERATLAFLDHESEAFPDMDLAEFEQHKQALITQLTEKAKNLNDRTGRYLADLDAGVTTFDSQARIAEIVATLPLETLSSYLNESRERAREARLLIYSPGRFQEVPTHGRRLQDPMALHPPAGAH